MPSLPEPPKAFSAFVKRFPKLDQSWRLASEAGQTGPLAPETRLLVKLALAAGALREGAVHSAARKALASGVSLGEMEQVIALSASTLGFPSAVALFSWIQDEVKKHQGTD